ncbi:MAG TPA: site-2 protease family protein, partial [Gemmataceae bacterium]|nr:site-2 protease family protein [Gemmataceae bacterium]
EAIWQGVKVALGLGLVIFIHELGHFVAAKWCDVHVQTFSIGFGPALPGCLWKYGETFYKIALFPLGGYVQMLGEGTESEEDENNPRSYKNKPVGQRMLIISAGVIMNVLLALVCFVIVFMAHGKRQPAGEIGIVVPGNPAWQKGIPSGSVLTRVGGSAATASQPLYFSDLQAAVLDSTKGQQIPIGFDEYVLVAGSPPGSPRYEVKKREVEVEPRKEDRDPAPLIGVWFPSIVQVATKDAVPGDRPIPYLKDSPAAAARKAFPWKPGDVVLATTDPEHPGQLADLPPLKTGDPDSEQDHTFVLARRWQALAGQPMTLRIRHGSGATEEVATEPAPFRWGDVIVGTSVDPKRPDAVVALPPDPRNPTKLNGQPLGDYYELRRREQLLAGQFMGFRVRHAGKDHAEEDLIVPPAYHRTLGTRMRMGKVAGIREGSPAEAAEVQKGDILKEVFLYREGHKDEKFHLAISEGVPGAQRVDPVRLPDELRRWADAHLRQKGDVVKAELTVVRQNPQTGKERAPVTLAPVSWDRSWEFDREEPRGLTAPVAIPELGLAYQVDSFVEDVLPGSPAAAAGLQKNDVIKAVRLKKLGAKLDEPPKDGTWEPESSKDAALDQWPSLFAAMQEQDFAEVGLRVERGGQVLELSLTTEPDASWPLDSRGVLLMPDLRLQKADNLGEAVVLGMRDTGKYILEVYRNLRGMITGRISAKNIGGPITIGTTAYEFAKLGIWEFLFFMGVISINLAVINFLPIPFLDGGHMVFLLYEKVRGRPATEHVQAIATYAGLLFLLLVMVCVFYLDIMRVIGNK